MIPIFIGFDSRETIAYHVLSQSIIDKTTLPVAVTPLASRMLQYFDGQRDGTNAFIYSRFLVPELMDYQGWAVYCDSDMLAREDLAELWALDVGQRRISRIGVTLSIDGAAKTVKVTRQ